MRTALLVAGILLLVLGSQGAIRLLIDNQNAGLLDWLPGGFPVQLTVYLFAAAAGVFLATRNAPGRTEG